jgi:hypothetical protein
MVRSANDENAQEKQTRNDDFAISEKGGIYIDKKAKV